MADLIKLADAYFCVDCDGVFEASEHATCTKCGGGATFRLDNVLNRKPVEDKQVECQLVAEMLSDGMMELVDKFRRENILPPWD